MKAFDYSLVKDSQYLLLENKNEKAHCVKCYQSCPDRLR